MGMRQKVKPKDLTVTLGISPKDLLSHYKEDMDIQGLKRSYLEGVARRMVGEERWGSYISLIQLDHPIWERPKEDEIEEFILHGGEASYRELLRKVTRAWEKVHVKDNKPKRKDTSSEESHTPWIKERVDRLKTTIARLEQDKEILEHSLYDATYENNQISYDLEQKDEQLLKNMEELRTERSKIQKTLGGFIQCQS
ncbi:hypothetical protein KIW84_022501 [Lathyrus oleraceus]|uniref:DUF7745 domain-containing protein n=1 Tax=Pisum sativum TaxID=3888 RepID=A0A9D4YBU4_PEA|nr:hypothetical protein KIW84_022501 [Pisum sativum]